MGTPHSPWGTRDDSINLLIHFVWLHGKNKGQGGSARLMKPPGPLLSPLPSHSLQTTKLILHVRWGISHAPTCLCLCWFPLTLYRKWRQIKAGIMKRIFLDWSWHYLAFNADLNTYHPGEFCQVTPHLWAWISSPVNEDTLLPWQRWHLLHQLF